MSQAIIIYNPSSGKEQSAEYAEKLNEFIQDKFETITMKETKKAGDAALFAKEATEERYDVVYLLGGDGTVNEVINGIAGSQYRPTVGVIPTGTVNNFARMLNIPMNPRQAIEAMAEAESKAIDIGVVNEWYFVSTVSAGSIPKSGRDVDSEAKTRFGPLAYVVEGIHALNSDETNRFKMRLDDEELADEFSIILIATGNSVAGIETFFPNTTLDDGYLNMMGLKDTTPLEKLALVPQLLSREDNYAEELVLGQYKHMKIEIVDGVEHETTVDGDKGPRFPLEINILPRHIRFYVLNEEV